MKNYLSLIIIALFVSCSSENDCEPQTEALEAIYDMYVDVLNDPQTTDQRRVETIAERDREVDFYNEDPCTYMERKWPEEYD